MRNYKIMYLRRLTFCNVDTLRLPPIMAIEEGKDNAAQKLFNKLNAASQANAMQPWQLILTRKTFSEID